MAQSATDIANYALGRLGTKRIADIEATGEKSARNAKLHYDQARREVLRAHRWNFALRRAELSRMTVDPVYGYDAQYKLPEDYIRLAEVNDNANWDSARADWFEIEDHEDYGLVLLTDETSIRIRYIADITSVKRFDPLFVEALSIKLAGKMARAITGSDKIHFALVELYNEISLPDARHADASETMSNENPPLHDAIRNSALVQARGARNADSLISGPLVSSERGIGLDQVGQSQVA
tara:strand:+ start:4541 stop:5254 length:714 start_codon:yes stop_codon:yes gene_type:complete